MYVLLPCYLAVVLFPSSRGHGLLLLYRPKDISDACVFSKHLRYDLSFGMGMSDTITLVFRTLTEIDYGCTVEVVTESSDLLVVVRYPNSVSTNCQRNRDAFTLLKKRKCIRFCDVTDVNLQTHYFTFHVKDRLRFIFVSNSSINADLNAHFYQVTVTSARLKPAAGCLLKNETICTVGDEDFCFTSGVVCDGIKNCGVDDWFDERKSQCSLPVEKLGVAPVITVMAAILSALLAIGHLIQRCLPPLADSFFIFNANEDNRLCIDPLLVPGDTIPPDIPIMKRASIIPVSSSSSSELSGIRGSSMEAGANVTDMELQPLSTSQSDEVSQTEVTTENANPEPSSRKSTLKSLTERLQDTLKSLTFTGRKPSLAKRTRV